MAKVPDPRRAREDDARTRAFAEAMQRLADEPGLHEEFADACGHATMAKDGDVLLWAMCDPAGQKAAAAVRLVLARRGLPLELVPWAVTLGVCGAASPAAAIEYYSRRVAPSDAIEQEPFTGQKQIVLRVPVDWSIRRFDAWVRLTRARFERAEIRGEPLVAQSRAGRTPKLTRDDAIELARRFDTALSAEWARQTPPRTEGMGRDAWIERFQDWLDRVGERHGAERIVRMHVRPALDARDLTLRTLDVAKRAKVRRSAARSRRGRNR